MASTMMELTAEARTYWLGPWNPNYQITRVLEKTMDRLLPDNIHIISNGRLYISVTKIIDGSNTVCENFASKAELIHAITSSAFIPVFSGHLPGKYRGQRVIDGGFSSNLIQLSDKTITVAPFAGDANICPMDDSKTREWDVHRVLLADQGTDITIKNLQRMQYVLYPPSPETLAALLEEGFRDGHRFLRKQGLAPCTQCLAVRSRVVRLYRNNGDASSGESSQDEEEDDVFDPAEKEPAQDFQGMDMMCGDKMECDDFATKNHDLPHRIVAIVDKFTSQAEKQFVQYRSSLDRRQQESMIGTIVRIFFKVASYSPAAWFMRMGFSSTKNIFMFLIKLAVEIMPVVEYITDKKTIKTAEELLGHLVTRTLSEDRYTKVQAGKVPPTHRRRPRHNLDCDISITHLGGPIEEEEPEDMTAAADANSPTVEKKTRFEEEGLTNLEWLNVSVNATTDSRHHLRPRNEEEAKQFQAENLLLASKSGNVSRAISRVGSRVGSRIMSRRASVQSSGQLSLVGSRRQSVSSLFTNESAGNETLDNIRRVTERTDSFLNYYYKDESGDLIMVNLYDISDTDPADILGDDVLEDDIMQQQFREEDLAAIDPNEVERYRMRFQEQDDYNQDPESDWDYQKQGVSYRRSVSQDSNAAAAAASTASEQEATDGAEV